MWTYLRVQVIVAASHGAMAMRTGSSFILEVEYLVRCSGGSSGKKWSRSGLGQRDRDGGHVVAVQDAGHEARGTQLAGGALAAARRGSRALQDSIPWTKNPSRSLGGRRCNLMLPFPPRSGRSGPILNRRAGVS